jgi:antitoxin component YwqK of YwqJK toxin-antitoxin module
MKVTFSILIASCFFIIQGSYIKKEYYSSGNIKSETLLNANNGWIKRYYESGQLMASVSIKNGKINGKSFIYFSSGKKAFENTFLNGIENGQQKEYFLSGRLKSKYMMKNGIPSGKGEDFFESGKTAAIWDYREKIAIGKTFYETGELFSINKFIDIALIQIKAFNKSGIPLNGEFKDFYNSGKLQIQGFFRLGFPEGFHQSYYESGKLSYSGFFLNGKPNGEHRIFSENGNIVWKIPYKNGKIDGIVLYYNPITSELMEKRVYENGNRIK